MIRHYKRPMYTYLYELHISLAPDYAIFRHLCFGFATWPQGVVGRPGGTFKMAAESPK